MEKNYIIFLPMQLLLLKTYTLMTRIGATVMNSRERVLRVFNHQEADKVPVDFGGTVVTCLDYYAHKNLKKYLKIADDNDPIIDYTMGTVEPCEQLKVMFESDFRRISLNSDVPDIVNGMYENGFGMKLKKAEPHEYFDTVYNPLKDATIEDLDHMRMPDADDPKLYYSLRDKAKDLYENSRYAIVADFGVPGFYETSQKLRGYENIACDLMIDRDFITALYDRLLKLQMKFFKNYLDQVGKYVQVIGYADDLGMQDRPQMSPKIYREVIKPYHKKIFKFIHEQADVKILLHSCGSIFPLIDELIDAGVDILNPVQTRAKDMDPENLKDTFGDRILFWGGIDEQYILPQGTKDEIYAEVERMIRIMGKNGGYILGPGHNIQKDTSPVNIISMYEAAKKFRSYK
jgi:uroporphyrinogen decarboxylase